MKWKEIPLERAVMYVIAIGIIPLLFSFIYFFNQKKQVEGLNQSIEMIRDQAFLKESKQATNLAVRHHFREADHFYIDKYLETIVCLEPEIELLEKISADKNFTDDEKIKKRLEFLTSESNSLIFSEGSVQTYPLFQETTETLVHPVEMNLSDLQKILTAIENIELGSFKTCQNPPQLIITDFKLDKKEVRENCEVFVLDLKLLKREFL